VNEAVEQAHRDGLLGAASLMVAGDAAADAVRRARRLPRLRVGLHLVLVEGAAVLPPTEIPDIVDAQGRFGSDQVRRGFSYALSLAARRQIAREIAAQFAAFSGTGLKLDHANAHKHMHLHPTVGRLLIDVGRAHGLCAVRVPAEPPSVLRACGTGVGIGGRALHAWTRLLRRQARRAGMVVNDHAFGVAWSGHMTAERLILLAAHLPDGVSEIYCHPARRRDAVLESLMPDYEPAAELAALTDPAVAAALQQAGAVLTSYGALALTRRAAPP